MQIELLWPILALTLFVLCGVLGWRYLTLAERLTKREVERNESFLFDCGLELSGVRADYDAQHERVLNRMLAMLDTKALESYADSQTAERKVEYVHEERMRKAEVLGETPVPYVRTGQNEEPVEQIGTGPTPM
jgi:uncharacterized Zn finger protein